MYSAKERFGGTWHRMFVGQVPGARHYHGAPFVFNSKMANADKLESWIKGNIADASELVCVRVLSSVGDTVNVLIFGTFSNAEDAILFKLKWEGVR